MTHPLEQATHLVRQMKRASNLLKVVDKTKDKSFLPTMAAGEVVELRNEVERWGTSETSIDKIFDELNDIWVLTASYLLSINYVPEYDLVTPSTVNFNGFGSRSNAFEKFQEIVLGLQDDPDDIYEVMKHLISIAKHLPVPNIMFAGFLQTIGKVLANRPPYLYSTWDPFFQRVLTPDEALLKYDHLEKMTKMLRAHLNRKLTPADWQPYALMMQDFTKTGQNQDMLQQIISGSESTEDLSEYLSGLAMRAHVN
jgi:hypothetical protein